MVRRVVGYIRLNNARVGQSKLPLEAQRMALAQFAKDAGLDIIAEFIEVEPGKGSDVLETRPQLAAALASARKHKCAVLVAKLGLLARNAQSIARLMSFKIPIVVAEFGVDSDPFRLPAYASLLEERGRMISERTRNALNQLKTDGVVLGNPKVLANHRTRAIASLKAKADRFAACVAPVIHEIQAEGAASHRAIARALNERGVATALGGKWSAVQVGAILRRVRIDN